MRALILFLLTLSLASAQDVDFLAPAVIEGRLLDSKGEPVAGVELSMEARFTQRSRAQSWTPPRTSSDGSGRFTLRVMPSDALELILTAEHADHARTRWTWDGLTSGQREDLGDLVLPPVGRVVGSILSEDGDVSVGLWQVDLRLVGARRVGEHGLVQRDYVTHVDSSTGEFRFEGIPVGDVRLDARLGDTETERAFVLVREGLEEVLDLKFTGPDPGLAIWVNWRYRPPNASACIGIEPTDPGDGPRIVLVSPEGERREVRTGGAYGGTAHFADLGSATYRVELDGPNFEPWALDGVRRGEKVQADLRGSAAIVLDVVDPETGKPVERSGVRIVSDRPDVPRPALVGGSAPPPTFTALEGLLPSSFDLAVAAPGYVPVRVRVDDLGSGERRVLRVELDRSRTLDVRVLDVDGAPVVDEAVEFLSGSGNEELFVRRETRTDASGRARFEGLGAGAYTFVAQHAPWLSSRTVLRADDRDDVRDLASPPHGWIDARLLVPPNLDANAFEFLPVDAESADGARWARASGPVADGTLRLGPLRPGVRELLARYPTPSGAFVQLELGAVAVVDGGVTAESWDLREYCPGWVRVDPPGEAPLDVVFRWTGGRPDRRALRHGGFLFAGLDPGSWQVVVRPVLGAWVWIRPEPVTIEPGKGLTLELGLELVERDVLIVDGDGSPVRSAVVATGPASDPVEALRHHRSNAEGRSRLTLPAGEVRFARRDGAPTVTVDWRAGSEEVIVRLPE